MQKIVLVDGHNLLFRMFYGIPARMRSHDGVLLNGVIGFIGAVLKYARLFEPDYFLVVFDGENPSFRNEQYKSYKQNRVEIIDADNPFEQLAIIKELLNVLGITHFECDGYEADDLVAAYVKRYAELETYIISSDTDLLQLVSDNVFLYLDRGKLSVLYDCDTVYDKFKATSKNRVLLQNMC